MTERRLQKNPAIPATPRIRDVRIESESDQKAVTGTGGRGSSCVPFKLGHNYDGIREFDIKRMEENAAKLEKDLFIKELETLDILEALGSMKNIVKDLKLELQKQPLRCMESPEHLPSQIKEITYERIHRNPFESPDMNLGKTMNNLSMIRSYVDSLNMEQKDFLGEASLAEELNSLRLKPPEVPDGEERFNTKGSVSVNPQCEQVKMVVETNDKALHKQSNACLAEMRLIAARKMEEAARAFEALATAEMTIISNDFCFTEPPRSPLTLGAHMQEELSTEILRKLEEANEEVKESQRVLVAAFNRLETANVKQLEAEDAFRQWNIESWKDLKAVRAKGSMKGDNFPRRSFLRHVDQHEPVIDLPKPVLKRNVSIGSVLNWKQIPTHRS